jgi:NapC/NirT cytochrome c family, N-terminal region/Cytochrome c554 and c-prime
MIKIRRLPLIVGGLVGLLVIFSTCVQSGGSDSRGPEGDSGRSGGGGADPRGRGYAGMAACLGCHKGIGDSYVHGAHALTSRVADIHSVAGSFAGVGSRQSSGPGNEFVYGPGRKVSMHRRDSGLFQVAVTPDGQEEHRFDIAVGSGRKAQTYLYWKGDGIFQLPVSYFVSEHSWANSPHYPMDSIWFGRAVEVGCFECHASYIAEKGMIHVDAFHGTSQYVRGSMVYGIDCERCHGPGALHVAWQAAHKEDTAGRYIARFAVLTRQQKLDVCAQCHSGGHASELRSLFRFKPGDTLANFVFADPRFGGGFGGRSGGGPANMDVHGNQYELLVASKCFLRSPTLECGSCHDPHARERDQLTVFAARCMNCHGMRDVVRVHAGIEAKYGGYKGLLQNCVDCHMPVKASQAITMTTQQQQDPVADLVRTHLIAIYPIEAGKKLAGHRVD